MPEIETSNRPAILERRSLFLILRPFLMTGCEGAEADKATARAAILPPTAPMGSIYPGKRRFLPRTELFLPISRATTCITGLLS